MGKIAKVNANGKFYSPANAHEKRRHVSGRASLTRNTGQSDCGATDGPIASFKPSAEVIVGQVAVAHRLLQICPRESCP